MPAPGSRTRAAIAALALLALSSSDTAAKVAEREHVRLRIDYLELREAVAVDVSVSVDGTQVWQTRLPAQTLHVNVGPVAARPGSTFSVTVSTAKGRVIGSATHTDDGTDSSTTVRQGEVARMIVSTRGVDVWAIPELRIRPPAALDDRQRIEFAAQLAALDAAIVDASDGQVRVARFTVERGGKAGRTRAGAIRIGRCKGACPRPIGTPAEPAAIRVASFDIDAIVGAFEHAYLAVPANESCWGAADEAAGDGGEVEDEPFDCRRHLAATFRALGIRLLPGGFDGPAPLVTPQVQFAGAARIDFSE